MSIQLEPWQIITLIASVLGFVIGLVAKYTYARLEASFNERRQAATDERRNLNDRVKALEEKIQASERDLLVFKADLPVNYVRREDFVHNNATLEAKIDGIASMMQKFLFEGIKHG